MPILLLCILCSLFGGCMYKQEYPEEWPQISTIAKNKCLNISGIYKNMDSNNEVSLAGILIKQWHGNKYFSNIKNVTIAQ
jgi:hypothetical protein